MILISKIIKWLLVSSLVPVIGFAGLYLYLSTAAGHRAEELRIFDHIDYRPLVIAHRGGAGLAPENTLEAFRLSDELGADVLELDVRMTSDGKLIVFHDSRVERTTNGRGAVENLTLAEIKKLDAGFRWTKDDGKSYPYRGRGVRVPSLRDVFETLPKANLNIELKSDTPSPVNRLCGLIREFDAAERVIVAAAMHSVLAQFRRECIGVATSASASESTGFLALYKIGLSKNFDARMQAFQIPRYLGSMEVVTRDFVAASHERNLKVQVWTINKREEMKRLIEIGVDGIMTDYPDRLLETINSQTINR